MEVFLPSAPLRPFVKSYRIIESNKALVNRVLPDTSIAMAFRFKGEIAYVDSAGAAKAKLSVATLSGLRKSNRLIKYAPDTAALIVTFAETGVSAFFEQPLHELFEKSISLDYFFVESDISGIEGRLASAQNNIARIEVIDGFLLSKLRHFKSDQLVTEAIKKIRANNGLVRIKDLANGLAISQDAFEKRFRRTTGATPKQFASIVKLRTLIQRNETSASFLDLALRNGYYDQAHFNKEFKLFTGLTPTKFFRSASFW